MTSRDTNTSRRLGNWIRLLVSALLVVALTGRRAPAQGPPAQITFVSISGIWHDPVDNLPGSQPGDPVITNGTPTSSIRWGQTSGTPQSGYDFTAVLPPPTTFPGPSFSFGTFTHRNFEVNSPSLTSVKLDIVLVLSVNGVQTSPLTFTYTFNHEETPNNANPCPYPTPPGEGCTDRVTIVSSAQPTTFNIGGLDYTFALNFNVNGNPATEFITREGGTLNTSGLDGNFVLPPVQLTVEKSGPATMNMGQFGDFALDVRNTGVGTAWDVSLRDLLPNGPTGGMCDRTPEIVSAEVFQADGVTPVPGKGPLTSNVDYTLSYSAAPSCRLDITMLTASGSIGPNERLIIRYRTQLDSNSQSGVALTNIAGAIQWFNGPTGNPSRQASTGTLTNGTVGTADHEDAHTVTVSLSGYFFEKTVADLNSGANPARTAGPGDRLRYTLRFRTTDQPLSNLRIYDEMDAMNASPAFVAGTLTLVAYPGGADISATSSTGGANGTGVLDIRGLNLPVDSEVLIQFDITLRSSLAHGAVVTDQAEARLGSGNLVGLSDDPTVNGTANPAVSGDEDLTRLTIVVGNLPLLYAEKRVVLSVDLGSPGIVDPGDTLRYTITVQNSGAVSATGVVLTDGVPANTTYLTNSTLLNGSPVGQPDGGVSPLASGITVGTIAAAGTATLQFDLRVNTGTPAGTLISNQAVVRSAELPNVLTDGDGNPATGPEPTVIVVGVGQQLSITKQVTVIGGGPALPGSTLEYVVNARNVASLPATNVVITDDLNASQLVYVNGSATMNGSTSGVSFAGSTITANYAAVNGTLAAGSGVVLRFRVVLNPALATGTVVTNTGVVAWNSPTQTGSAGVSIVIGSMPGSPPSLYAEKRVALFGDLGSPGIVDPGDTLRYTITVRNGGAASSTGVVLTDGVPANTTYVANSTLLNGVPFGQPDGGVSPLASGINAGTIAPGVTATLQFDLRVNAGTPAGTLISNQAVVRSAELPNVLTDGDGNPSTGPEPTVIVVGVGQQLSITKQVTVIGGGPAVPGATLEYLVNATNIAASPAFNVVITDDLNASQSGQLAYVSGSATMNGSTPGVSFTGSTITANYASVNGTLAPGAGVALRFRAVLNANLALNTVVTNTGVVAWNNPTQTANASVSVVVGVMPGLSVLNGSGWHDANFNDTRDSSERALAGWTVELFRNNSLLNSVLTDANGVYRFIGVDPNYGTGNTYELRFVAPGAGANTAMLGRTVSPFTNGLQRISNIIVQSGANLQNLDLAIHPNGVIYNSLARTPVTGAALTLLDARSSSPLPASCFDDATQQGQVTLEDGYYKFDVNFSDPACPSGGDYLIDVTGPGTNYVAGYSQIIPPASGPSTAAFSVPSCPSSASDTVPGTALFCEVQPSEFAPGASVPLRSTGTTYYARIMLNNTQMPGTSQIFNNHIPIDPQVTGTIAISKTTPMVNVTRGQLVPYVITLNNLAGQMLNDVSIVDRAPAGFTYVAGSALIDGVPSEPSVAAGTLSWNGLAIAGRQVRTVKLLLAAGAGVSEGEYVNRAQALITGLGNALSGEATATVRIVPDPTFDCTDVTGKVFNDANRNGLQDDGEEGLPGVRVVTATGLQATTDQYGRYHVTCAITPNESRGSNFVLKLDDRTLPSGFRLTTDQIQIKRATRGKALKLNFGASIHKVVSIDLSDAVFERGATEIRLQWRPRLDLLLEELRKAPAVLRLSYVADIEDAALVERRVSAVKRYLTEAWKAQNNSYLLTIEPEVFWRRGAPPKRADVRAKESR